MTSKHIQWNGALVPEALDILRSDGGMIVSPTKVGYIVMVNDRKGLERKFTAKNRLRSKPAVVLCGSMEQLEELAELNDEIRAFYQLHWDQNILMGCILPWSEKGKKYLSDDAAELVTDRRDTSCFVIRFGTPGEQLAAAMWEQDKSLSFASSANVSGKGNRGVVAGIGDAIDNEADLVIESDEYVASFQADCDQDSRYEQGVMVSFVDESGVLVPEQKGQRDVTPAPTLIRSGLNCPEIMENLAASFLSWDYRHGHYY